MRAPDRTLRGTVTRTDARGAYVEVPALGLGVEFGPCQVLFSPWLEESTDLDDLSAQTLSGSTSQDGAHAHPSAGAHHAADPTGAHAHGAAGAHDHAVTVAEAPHRHHLTSGAAALLPGHQVLLATVNGIAEDLVVLGRLA